MLLLSVFALIGLFLGAIGIYGVMAQAVATRRREIGLRMALGSTTWNIASLVGREWTTVVGFGLVLGMIGTLAATRGLVSLLYETKALAPSVMISAATIVLATYLIACVLPACRAIQIDPATVLKEE